MSDLAVCERDLLIDASRIKVRLLGDIKPERSVLVFVHEGLGSITQWRDFPESLCAATGLSAMVYDRTGYGRSSPQETPWPDDFLIAQAHMLPLILHKLSIRKPILFGHSDGGTIALMVAALYPHLPVATITEAAHVMIEPMTKQGLRSLLNKTTADPSFVTRLLRHHPQADASFIINWIGTWLRPSLAQWTMLDMLPDIVCSVLALQGAQDEHGSYEQIECIIKGTTSTTTSTLIPDCGHVPHIEARQAVIDAVTKFLQKYTQ